MWKERLTESDQAGDTAAQVAKRLLLGRRNQVQILSTHIKTQNKTNTEWLMLVT